VFTRLVKSTLVVLIFAVAFAQAKLESGTLAAPRPAPAKSADDALQQPRVFYRRESESTPLIVAKPN
jgi:hypothetical protein